MELPESCKNCEKPKTIHLTQVVNKQATKIHLCKGCSYATAAESKISSGILNEILKEKEPVSEDVPFGETCSTCGMTQEEFKKIGRFGCPGCYGSFSEAVRDLLPDMHRGTHHRGKVPGKIVELATLEDQVIKLELQIHQAVSEEDYEKAAGIRERLNKVKSQIQSRYEGLAPSDYFK